jgi:toxin YhaV
MSSAGEALVVNGWTVFAHPLFVAQLQTLTDQVAALQDKDPQGYTRKNATKRLAAIRQLALEVIPRDPTRPEYRQSNTLGNAHRHWFRAKFFQQYRLFFRFHAASRIIVLAWVNDEDTRRAYESAADTRRAIGMNC